MKKIVYIILLFSAFVNAQILGGDIIVLESRTTLEMNALTTLPVGSYVDNSDTGTLWRYNGSLWVDTGAVSGGAAVTGDEPVFNGWDKDETNDIVRGTNTFTEDFILNKTTGGEIFINDNNSGIEYGSSLGVSVHSQDSGDGNSGQVTLLSENTGGTSSINVFPFGIRESTEGDVRVEILNESGGVDKLFIMDGLYDSDSDMATKADVDKSINDAVLNSGSAQDLSGTLALGNIMDRDILLDLDRVHNLGSSSSMVDNVFSEAYRGEIFESASNISSSGTLGNRTSRVSNVGGTFWNHAVNSVSETDASFYYEHANNRYGFQSAASVRIENLAGQGDQMVVVNDDGDLSTQAIPSGGTGSSLSEADQNLANNDRVIEVSNGSLSVSQFGNPIMSFDNNEVIIEDEPYDAVAWDGSTALFTKNAFRDVIEGLATGGADNQNATEVDLLVPTDYDNDATNEVNVEEALIALDQKIADDISSLTASDIIIEDDLEDISPLDGTVESFAVAVNEIISNLTIEVTPVSLLGSRTATIDDLNRNIDNRTTGALELTIPENFGSVGDAINLSTLATGGVVRAVPQNNNVTFLNFRETLGNIGDNVIIRQTGTNEWVCQNNSGNQSFVFTPSASTPPVFGDVAPFVSDASGSNTLSVTMPSIVENDGKLYVVMNISSEAGNVVTVAPPIGWSLLQSNNTSHSTHDFVNAVYEKDNVDGTEDATVVNFTLTGTVNGYYATSIVYDSATTTEGLTNDAIITNSNTWARSNVTSTVDNSIVVTFGILNDNFGITFPDDYTTDVSSNTVTGDDFSIVIGHKVLSTSGTDIATDTFDNNGSESGSLISIVINPN